MKTLAINYEQLVISYKENLTTVLRGFKPADGFLETWVHDEDDVMSLLNIIESAEVAGRSKVSIYIGPQTLKILQLPRLKEMAEKIGIVEIQPSTEGLEFTVSFKKMRNEIDPLYQKKLAILQTSCTHEGSLEAKNGCELLTATNQGIAFMALVEKSTHIVQKAVFNGDVSKIQKGILEGLCRLIENKPILECGDHVAIRLEYELRDRVARPPVSGIILPSNTDETFCLSEMLIRSLLREYREKTNFTSTENFFHPRPSSRWHGLSKESRIKQINETLEEFCVRLEVPIRTLVAVDLESDVMVIVKCQTGFGKKEESRLLLELESFLKEKVEQTLEIYSEELKDLNKIRRL